MEEIKEILRTRKKGNLVMVGINILVFVLLSCIGNVADNRFMMEHGVAYTPFILQEGEYYRLFTCMFLHFSLTHLFYNMVLLFFVGDILEQAAGTWRYLIIYLIGGIGGNVVSMAADEVTHSYPISAGASGAVFAVLGGLIWILIRNKGRLEEYSLKRVLFLAALSTVEGLTVSGTDNWAHVGGLLSGFLAAMVVYRKKTGDFG